MRFHKEVWQGARPTIQPPSRLQANNATQTQSKLDFSLSFYIQPSRDRFKSFTDYDNLEQKSTKSGFTPSLPRNRSSDNDRDIKGFKYRYCAAKTELLRTEYTWPVSCPSVMITQMFLTFWVTVVIIHTTRSYNKKLLILPTYYV